MLPEIPLWIMALTAVTYLGLANKPIWLDEVLHFAMGSMSFEEVLRAIDYTTIELNHGQTGVYILTDWFLLQVFGASAFALRLPSLLAGLVMFWAAWTFIRNRGYAWPWQYLVFIALFSQLILMSYINEARPYLPLVASVVSMLVFYTATSEQRRLISVRVLGVLGIVIGATMHPYWILYWLILVVFGALVVFGQDREQLAKKNFLEFIGWRYVVPALALFLIIGQLTWMRLVREFDFDPYFMIGSRENAIDRFLINHIYGSLSALEWVIVLVLLPATMLTIRPWAQLTFFWPPALLWLIGIGSSLAITYLSISRNYWIFERQWLPGIALSAIAIVWFVAELHRQAGPKNVLMWVSVVGVSLIYMQGAWSSTQAMVNWKDSWHEQQLGFTQEERTLEELTTSMDDTMVVYAANVNVSRGGEIWPQFADWYKNQAGMRPEFRETNPSWMDAWFGKGFD